MPVTIRPKNILLAVGIGLGLFFLLIVGLSLLLRQSFVQEKVRTQIQSALQARVDGEVQIGSVRLDPLRRSLKISNLRVSPRGQPGEAPLLIIENAALYPNPWELLRLRLRLHRLVLRSPKVRIQPSMLKAAPEQTRALTTAALTLPLGIARLEVLDGEVIWGEEGRRITLSGLQGRIRAPAGQVEGSVDTAEMKIETGKMSLVVTDFGLGAAVQGDDLQINRLRLTAMESVIQGQGRVGNILNDPAINLTINAQGEVQDLFPRKPPVSLGGKFRLNGKIAGPITDPSFTGQAEVGRGQVEQLDLTGMKLVLNGNRERLQLTQLDVQGVDGTLTGDMTLIWKNLQYHLNLLGKGVNLTQILRPIAGRATVGGNATIQAQVVGEGTDLSKLRGQIKIGVEQFHLLKRPEERGHVRISLQGGENHVQIQQFEIAMAQTHFSAAGTLKAGERLDMKVLGQTANLAQIAGLFGSKPHQLAGKAKFDGHLTGPLADPVLKGSLKWTEATLLGVTLSSVRGPLEMAMAQRTLKSPSLDAVHEQLRGRLNLGLTLLSNPPDRKLNLKHDLKLRIRGDIEGSWKKFIELFVKKELPVTGRLRLNGAIEGTPENLSGQGTLRIPNFTLFGIPWDQAQTALRLEQRKILLEGFVIQSGKERIVGKAEIQFDGRMGLTLSSTPISIQRIPPLRDAGFTGTATILSAQDEAERGQELISAKVDFGKLAYGGSSLGAGQGRLSWNRSKEEITGLIRLPSGYRLQGNLLTKGKFPYEGTLAIDNGNLRPLFGAFQERLPTGMNGVVSGSVQFSGRLGEKVPQLVQVDLDSARLELQEHSFQTAGKAKFTYKNGQLTIPRVTLKGVRSDITIGGTIAEEMDLTIRGSAPTAMASVLSPEISGASGRMKFDMAIQGPRSLPRYRGHIEITASSITLREHPEPIEKLQGKILFTENSADGPALEAQWGGGKLRATIKGKREENGWHWPIEYTLKEARVERIFVRKKEAGLPALATGQLQSMGTLNVITGPGLEWLSTLQGKVELKAGGGKIQRSFAGEKILTAINVTGLFRKDPGGKGMTYDEMSATFLLDKGIAKTENLLLRSPSLRAGGTGQIDLVKRTCDMQIAVRPLQLTDDIVRAATDLPIIKNLGVGSLLFGKDQSILVVTYHVHGPLDKLQLNYIPSKGIRAGVLGAFEKTLGLPANLFMRRGKEGEDRGERKPKDAADKSP